MQCTTSTQIAEEFTGKDLMTFMAQGFGEPSVERCGIPTPPLPSTAILRPPGTGTRGRAGNQILLSIGSRPGFEFDVLREPGRH
jgi:hypothetical protein